ncbi:50S ribosomal protein L11 methyltransferase [Umezawaea sp. Da 62-37]|uniref:class I SAM-dependent methyltransferase n=1 Tax=Umezawaea sp. Da 62-37 TaxID=3075927 RepID=UPI0028F6C220|nr:50S ribosomal protein L11 methyltransferase [Umezawaea sp. Da 62-37]WNV86786.1 50S ribosomal protein L11 methyltransferase [Umezawaea sp. Da 62-37]
MDHSAFVLANTHPQPVPLVPEIVLRGADDVIALWEATDETAPPFWAFPWAGGQALARYLLDHPHLVEGRRVLDLAAGSGLVAIAARLAGAGDTTANDIDPRSAAAVTLNAALNDTTVHVVTADLLDEGSTDFDVVLAGDVFYDRDMAARVLPFLRAAADRGATVLVGDPQRAHLPHAEFTVLAGYDVPVHGALESAEVKHTTVLTPK